MWEFDLDLNIPHLCEKAFSWDTITSCILKMLVTYFLCHQLKVVPPGVLEIIDGEEVSYKEYLNVTCEEKEFNGKFAGWKADLTKPLDEIQVCLKI